MLVNNSKYVIRYPAPVAPAHVGVVLSQVIGFLTRYLRGRQKECGAAVRQGSWARIGQGLVKDSQSTCMYSEHCTRLWVVLMNNLH